MGDIAQIVLIYSLWLASAALSLWVLLWVRILVLIDLPVVVFRVNPWVLRAIDRFGIVVLGIVWLIWVVVSESYFRRLYKEHMPAVNILRVFIAEGLLLGVAYCGRLLIRLWIG